MHFYVGMARLPETLNPGSSAHNVDPTHLGERFLQGQVPAHIDMTPRNAYDSPRKSRTKVQLRKATSKLAANKKSRKTKSPAGRVSHHREVVQIGVRKESTDPRGIRTPNRLIWSQTRCRCAMEPIRPFPEYAELCWGQGFTEVPTGSKVPLGRANSVFCRFVESNSRTAVRGSRQTFSSWSVKIAVLWRNNMQNEYESDAASNRLLIFSAPTRHVLSVVEPPFIM